MLSSPFWEGLTVVLICGLLSSTLLVILVFPYYYLGAEFLRLRISRTACLMWLALTALFIFGLVSIGMNGGIAFLLGTASALALTAVIRSRRRPAASKKNVGRYR